MYTEKKILDWLKGRLPVPEVLFFGETDDIEYLLITEIKGANASEETFKNDKYKTVSLIAEGLKLIHNVNISDCPFDVRLDNKILEVQRRIENGLVNEGDFDEKYLGKPAEELFEMLFKLKPVILQYWKPVTQHWLSSLITLSKPD